MTRRRPRGRTLAAGLLVVLACVAGTTALARAGAEPDRCAVFAKSAAQRAALVTGSGTEVLVIGDSYSVGAGLRPHDSWPVRLPGRVRVDGFSGSGFSAGASPCGDLAYASRAPGSVRPGTALVVVEGGLNDTDQPLADLEAGAARVLDGLAGTPVLVVGPPSAPARDRGLVRAVDAALARAAAAHGASYLSMAGVDLTYLDDRLHPDAAGHRVFGDRVAAEVESLLAAGR